MTRRSGATAPSSGCSLTISAPLEQGCRRASRAATTQWFVPVLGSAEPEAGFAVGGQPRLRQLQDHGQKAGERVAAQPDLVDPRDDFHLTARIDVGWIED